MTKSNQPIARLLWQTENGQQELMLHSEDTVTIGRGDANTIVISSARVSRNHARIEWTGDSFTIRDMSSSNGTFVNGQRVEYMPWGLRDGDLIMLERVPIHFEEIRLQRAEQDGTSLRTVPMGKQGKDAPMPRLVITEGPDVGREINIDEDAITIGRESQSATWKVQLKDSTVSRPHARIEHHKGVYTLIDLGSANGTTLNDLFVIVPVTLSDGDVIGVGATKLTFRRK
jgi:pSer/pThr/pTyr-binding forkhead associated (FHA) protein